VKKFLIFLVLLVMAVLIAGTCGIIHDQITYSISSEYYTKFKFLQFGLVESQLPGRVKVALVGFLASWWMGIPIGLLVGLLGFIHRDHRRMFQVTFRSFVLVAGFTLAFGLAGLACGYYRTSTIHLRDYDYWFVPDNLVDLRRFLCVGYMHNSSYLGGAASIVVAWIFHVIVRLRRDVCAANEADPTTAGVPPASDFRVLPAWLIPTIPALGIGLYLSSYFIIVDLHHPTRLPILPWNNVPNRAPFVEISLSREWIATPDYHGLPSWLFRPIHDLDRNRLRQRRWSGTRSHTEELSFKWLLGNMEAAWDPMTRPSDLGMP
jgi:hypothetical protein